MPELPEVETITRMIRDGVDRVPGLVGQTVTKADVFWARTVEKPSAKNFKKWIVGQKILDIRRRGKYIIIELSEKTMLIHLRMSGDLRVGTIDQELGKHVRLAIYLNSGYQLAFNNPRKFGRVWLVDDPEEVLGKLGPEPLNLSLTPEDFYHRLNNRNRQIKPLLIDQSFIAGLGNIYTDEALHRSKIHPLTRSNEISKTHAKNLLNAIREVLKEGIRRNGASIDWVYQGGEFQNHFRVYQRSGKPCPECNSPISRIVVGQRGTHICITCQTPPG